jgi:hypothetical protein
MAREFTIRELSTAFGVSSKEVLDALADRRWPDRRDFWHEGNKIGGYYELKGYLHADPDALPDVQVDLSPKEYDAICGEFDFVPNPTHPQRINE